MKYSKIITLIILSIIIIISFLMPLETSKNYSYYLFITQLLLIYYYVYKQGYLFLFLTPIMLTISYIDFSFFLGNYAFSHGIVIQLNNYSDYLKWKHTNYITTYILAINMILFIIEIYFHKRYLNLLKIKTLTLTKQKALVTILVSSFFFLIFLFIPLDVSFLGGKGDMSYVPKAITALIIIYILAYYRKKYRVLIYLFIFIVFASFSYGSKREAVFLIIPILLIESLLNIKRIQLKALILFLLFSVFLIFIVLVMTILRGNMGYIQAGQGNIIDAMYYVDDYLRSDEFLAYFFLNIETNYTYFHTMQAIEYVSSDTNLLTYGSTLIKFIFILIPRTILESKPHSVTYLYTELRSADFLSRGGSWPPNIYAEMFWNFYYFGIFPISIMFYWINIFFSRLINKIQFDNILLNIWLLFAYMQILFLVRGSGLDLYIVYIIFGFFFSNIYKYLSFFDKKYDIK